MKRKFWSCICKYLVFLIFCIKKKVATSYHLPKKKGGPKIYPNLFFEGHFFVEVSHIYNWHLWNTWRCQLARLINLIYGNVDVNAIEIDSNIDETFDKSLAKPLEDGAIFVEVEALELVSRCRNFLKIAMVVFEFILSFTWWLFFTIKPKHQLIYGMPRIKLNFFIQ